MDVLQNTPFAALTLIAAPAVLTNASSVLALGTSNRFARAVDRQRQLSAMLEDKSAALDRETAASRLKQLRRAERRAQLLLRALTSFYAALGAFAAASLISVLGAAVIPPQFIAAETVTRWAALLVGAGGVVGLVIGASLLVRETRLALEGLREEAKFTVERFRTRSETPDTPAPTPARDQWPPGPRGGI